MRIRMRVIIRMRIRMTVEIRMTINAIEKQEATQYSQ